MWTAWTIIGLTQIGSTRYLKHKWRLNMWIHIFGGTMMLLVTLLYGIGGYIRIRQKGILIDDWHSVLG
jgi:hypothetical protein